MDKTLHTVLSGLADKNVRFDDLTRLVRTLGFAERTRGDHHIFSKDGIMEIINLQSLKNGQAKAYQVKQVRNLILKYKLHGETRGV